MSAAAEAFHEEVAKGLTREMLESLVSDLREIAAMWPDGSGEQLTIMVASNFIASALREQYSQGEMDAGFFSNSQKEIDALWEILTDIERWADCIKNRSQGKRLVAKYPPGGASASVAGIPCRFCLGRGSESGPCPDCARPRSKPTGNVHSQGSAT